MGNFRPVRAHHYTFAHIALREIVFANPLRFFWLMSSENAGEFIAHIWHLVSERCEEDTDLRAEDIQFYTTMVKNCPVVVFVMPQPIGVTEAFMIAIVLKTDSPDPEHPEIVYYTLEYGMTLDDTPRTVLCGWEKTAHRNYGDGPPADIQSFLNEVSQRI